MGRPSLLTLGITVISTIAAFTAKETRQYTLDEIDDVKQSDKEKAVVAAATVVPTAA